MIEDEARKVKEAEFHDRREQDRLSMSEAEWKAKYANKQFYDIARAHWGYFDDLVSRQAGGGSRALDYCCGLGNTALRLAQHGFEVVGIDISPQSVAAASTLLAHHGFAESSAFFVMDAEKMKFEDDRFDIVVCNGVLHHLDVHAAFPEIARVLKPTGTVICIEALGYNPVINAYRRRTPHLRTEWEAEHILRLGEVNLAKRYFGEVDVRFFYLATMAAFPFRRTRVFDRALASLAAVDRVILRIPGLRRMAWQMVFTLRAPRAV